jgi:integrase
MASIRKKIGSKFWFACFMLPGGMRTQRSTKTEDRKLALKLAGQFEDAARKRLTEGQVRIVFSNIHEQIHGSPLCSVNVADYFKQWLSRKEGEVANVTHKAYEHAVQEFVDFLGEHAAQPLQFVTTHQVSAWRDSAAKRATATTANNKLKIVRTFFESAWRENLIIDNPAAKVSVLKTTASNRRPFTVPELKILLSNAFGEWKGMILFGFYTGQRLKDIASLTWAHVDMAKGQIVFSTSKTGRSQVIPLAPSLRNHVATMPCTDNPRGPLFPKAFRIATGNTDTSRLSQQFHEILVDSGLANPRPPKRTASGIGRQAPRQKNELTFHSLRHTTTSFLKSGGTMEAVARDIIGHDSAEISRHYTHTDENSKRAAVARLPDITEPTKKLILRPRKLKLIFSPQSSKAVLQPI